MLTPTELISSITALAAAIAQDKTVDELGVLAAAFAQLGDTLATIAVQRGIIEDAQNKNDDS